MINFCCFKSNKELDNFPGEIISKHDETNIQYLPWFFKEGRGQKWSLIENINGQSVTYLFALKKGFLNKLFNRMELIVCSKNWKRLNKQSTYWQIAISKDIHKILKNHWKETNQFLAIYGKITGPKIEKNPYDFTSLTFFVDKIKIFNENRYMTHLELIRFCRKTGLDVLPIIEDEFDFNENMSTNEFMRFSDGNSLVNPKVRRDGVILRSHDTDSSAKARYKNLFKRMK